MVPCRPRGCSPLIRSAPAPAISRARPPCPQPGPKGWAILPVEDFQAGPAGPEELQYRQLWRAFYDTIAIEGRYNPKCRMTHMPKRYWAMMTEFREAWDTALPEVRTLPPSPQ